VTLVPPSGLRLDLKQGAVGAMGASGAKGAARRGTAEVRRSRKRHSVRPASPASVVDRPGNGRRGHLRFHQSRDSSSRRLKTLEAPRASLLGWEASWPSSSGRW
jgi:hypothetical protein